MAQQARLWRMVIGDSITIPFHTVSARPVPGMAVLARSTVWQHPSQSLTVIPNHPSPFAMRSTGRVGPARLTDSTSRTGARLMRLTTRPDSRRDRHAG